MKYLYSLIFVTIFCITAHTSESISSLSAVNIDPGYILNYDLRSYNTNWYSADQRESITASSTLKDSAKSTYNAGNIHDGMFETAWVEGKNLYMLNSRVKSMTMYVDDKLFADIKLNDFYGFQQIDFPSIPLPLNKTVRIKFVITDVYPGSKYSDTSISGIWFFGGGIL